MKKLDLANKVTRSVNKVGFKLKKHSPEILITAGVIGTVTSAVMACKATTKVSAIIDEAKKDIDDIHYGLEHPEMLKEAYTVEDSKKDLAIVYSKTGVKLVKLYAPAVILGALSLTSIIKSNDILRKRNVALAAAYATVDGSYKQYRSRLVERFGKELDRELKYNIKTKEIEETVIDEKGKEKTVKKTIEVIDDPNQYSEYSKFFDEYCAGWDKDPEVNLAFLKCQQNSANQILQERGYLFLNEVYDMLGIPRTKAGQVVGWVYDKDIPVGDNFVDFGIYNVHRKGSREFVNGHERSILLDFNVDGNILDMF